VPGGLLCGCLLDKQPHDYHNKDVSHKIVLTKLVAFATVQIVSSCLFSIQISIFATGKNTGRSSASGRNLVPDERFYEK